MESTEMAELFQAELFCFTGWNGYDTIQVFLAHWYYVIYLVLLAWVPLDWIKFLLVDLLDRSE